jgi:hypothetical protein
MANGTLAASQIEMLSQDGTGIMTIVPPATNTNQTLTLPDSTGTVSTLGVGTAVSASGTSVDFTGIPSWVKRITVMLFGVSTNGTSPLKIRMGDSDGIETTGYSGYSVYTGTTTVVGGANFSSGFDLPFAAAAAVVSGSCIFTLADAASNSWVAQGVFGRTETAQGGFVAGSKSLSDTLTQIRVTTNNGTDTFDAGTINILYEG